MSLLESWRVSWRIPGMLLWTISTFTLRVLVMPVGWFSRPTERRLRAHCLRLWGRGCMAIAGMRPVVRGAPPRGPAYMVSNHLTLFDLFPVAAYMGSIFVAKAEIKGWPLFGFIVSGANTIYINRERMRDTARVNSEIERAIQDGIALHIFAEGGVSTEATVRPFKAALLEPAAKLGLPVHHLTIHYATPPGSPPAWQTVVWHYGVPFFTHVCNVLKLPYITTTLTFGDAPIQCEDRRELARELTEAVQKNFVPMRPINSDDTEDLA